MRILLVGAGLASASLIHFLKNKKNFRRARFTVIDQRSHVGGNCYCNRDPETGTNVHVYGPHIFNANSDLAWDFINTYLPIYPFVNRVKACTATGIYSFPINLHTINQFFGLKLGPSEAKKWMDQQCAPFRSREPRNFEEAMLAFLGQKLYEEFIFGYTSKQWGVNPSSLPASIARRLPFRLDYDDNYYNKRYQGLPQGGYTPLFDKIFSEEGVSLQLNYAYEHTMAKDFDLIIYTGPIDEYFSCDLGRLSYRTVYWNRHVSHGQFQGNAVINYTDISVPYTRINEPCYFEPWLSVKPETSVYFVEYSKATESGDIPYYPVRLGQDKKLLSLYQKRAQDLNGKSEKARVIFHGRLGTYQYLDMDKVIEMSSSLADQLDSDY